MPHVVSPKTKTYALVGGGSGGHIIPLLAVAAALKDIDSDCKIVHIGHKGDPLNNVTRESEVIDETYEVSAGKFRRYHSESIIKQAFDLKTIGLNVRDFFRFTKGYMESMRLLRHMQPCGMFMKGGYVCASVGLAAGRLNIPYVTHDSDAMVSLAHKIIAKNARMHLTALSPDKYPSYDQSKILQTGVPVRSDFTPLTDKDKVDAKKALGYAPTDKFVLITGGGLGSQILNDAVIEAAPALLSHDIKLRHLTGKKLYSGVIRQYDGANIATGKDIVVEDFNSDMSSLSSAADVVVTRAGMTAVSEFAAQKKALIVVPNPYLTGGHQLKNADYLQSADAIVRLDEDKLNGDVLEEAINLLMDDTQRQKELSENLHAAAMPQAAERCARILVELVGH